MRITETIRHGNYHNVRSAEMEDTYEAFVTFLQASPYATPAIEPGNKYVQDAYDNLMARGITWIGWADYTLV